MKNLSLECVSSQGTLSKRGARSDSAGNNDGVAEGVELRNTRGGYFVGQLFDVNKIM